VSHQIQPDPAGEQAPAQRSATLTSDPRAMGTQSFDYMALGVALQEVIAGGGPDMVFQPIVELRGSRIIGLEALARFPPARGYPTNVWFSAAGKVGLLTELELSAASVAITRCQKFPSDAFISINLSPSTLASDRFQGVAAMVPSTRLVIEVSETAAVNDYEMLHAILRPLREEGARLACDDAGAGFASLRHILQLAPDIIKLDITLTRGIDSDPSGRALAAALISFASETGTMVVAEGIETAAECDELIALGVEYGQGYFLGHPAPLP
jgi:EAL domain-containing protein (putative c-di-GMP-specific phosphodiesterase class I)